MEKNAELIPSSRLMTPLRRIVHRLEGEDIEWALVGSLGLSIRGASIEPRDIDILTDEEGAYRMERIFSDHVVSPVIFRESEFIISHFGELRMDGVKVEIMGDFRIRLDDGTWQAPPDLRALKEYEPVDDILIPVLSLKWESDSYSKLGRSDRARAARAIMANRTSRRKVN